MSVPYEQLVGQMREEARGLEECPLPTQDEGTNERNRQLAVSEANYRESKSEDQRCGTCSNFDQSAEMLMCIQGGPIESGDDEPGYCRAWNFICASMQVCNSWQARDGDALPIEAEEI